MISPDSAESYWERGRPTRPDVGSEIGTRTVTIIEHDISPQDHEEQGEHDE